MHLHEQPCQQKSCTKYSSQIFPSIEKSQQRINRLNYCFITECKTISPTEKDKLHIIFPIKSLLPLWEPIRQCAYDNDTILSYPEGTKYYFTRHFITD